MNLFFPMLAVGLLTGFHCVTMCGSMVFSYSVGNPREGGWLQRISPQFAYQAAKILSYISMGLLLGAIGAVFNLAGVRNWATIVAGVFMILVGLQLTGWFPTLRKFSPRAPKFLVRWIMSLRKRSSAKDQAATEAYVTPVLFGLMTGLMPCGPLIAAELAAAGSGSAANGAIAMLGFGLGTVPVMLAFGSVASMISARFQKQMSIAAAIVVIVLGGMFINRGAVLLGSPVSFESVAQAVTGGAKGAGAQAAFAQDASGVAEVKLTIKNTQFVPGTVTIPSDRPVKLVVDRQEDNACSDQIAIPQLGILQNLKANGTTVVDIPATKGGTYRLTCGMGMMSGTLAAVAASGAQQSAAVPSGAAQAPTAAAAQAPAAAQGDTIAQPQASTQAAAAGSAAGGCCGGGSASAQGGSAAGGCCGGGAQASPAALAPKAAKVAGGVQKIAVDVSKGYYDPSNIVLKARVPAEITFSKSSGCTAQVVSEDLQFSEDLSSGPKTVKIPALKPGHFTFHCGMNMVSGTITVQ
jgi:sulfite exporter TauE/SafE/plastocyanin domain-containing protein